MFGLEANDFSIVAENPELLLAAGKPRGRGRPRKNGGAYAMGFNMPQAK